MNHLIYIARKNAVKTWRSYPKPPKNRFKKPVIEPKLKHERKNPPNLIYLLFYIVFGKP